MAEQEFGYIIRAVDDFSSTLNKFKSDMQSTGTTAETSTKAASSAFMDYTKTLVAGVATYATVKAAATAFYNMMLEQERITRQVSAAYGDMADNVMAKSEEMARGTIFDNDEIASSFAKMHDIVSRLGLTFEQESSLMSTAMNISAIRGTDLGQTINALEMAMLGNSRAARQLGLTIDENTVKNSQYAAGLKENWKYLTEEQKAQLSLMVIQDQAAKYTGQAALATTTLSGSIKQLTNTILDYFEPTALAMAGWFGNIINWAQKAAEKMSWFGKVIQTDIALAKGNLEVVKQIWTTPTSGGAGSAASSPAAVANDQKKITDEITKQVAVTKAKEESEKRSKELGVQRLQQLEKEKQLLDEALNFSARQYELTEDELRLVNDFLDIDGTRLAAKEAGHVAVMGWIEAEYQAEIDAIEKTAQAEAEKKRQENEGQTYWSGNKWIDTSKLLTIGQYGYSGTKDNMLAGIMGFLSPDEYKKRLEDVEVFEKQMEECFTVELYNAVSSSFSSLFNDALVGNIKSGLDYVKGFADQVRGIFSNMFGNMAATELAAGAPGAGMAITGFMMAASTVVNMLNQGGGGASSEQNFDDWLQENLGMSSSGSGAAGFMKGFTGKNVQMEAVFDTTGIKAQFQELMPIIEDTTDLAVILRDEFGMTGMSVEEMTAQMLISFKEGDKTLAEFAASVRDFYAQSIVAGNITGEWGTKLESFNETASRLSWLEQLKTDMADLMTSGYDFTSSQIDQLNYYIDLIGEAENGNIEAFDILQSTFADTQDYIDSLNAGIETMQDEYKGLQEEAQKLNDIMGAAVGLQDNINKLLVEKATGWNPDTMKYATDLLEIYSQVADYKEQFAGRQDLLSAADQYGNLSVEKLKADYMSGGGTESGWQSIMNVAMNTPQIDIVTPLETESGKLQTELNNLGNRIVLEQQNVATITATIGERIILALGGQSSSTNPLLGSGFTPGVMTDAAWAAIDRR